MERHPTAVVTTFAFGLSPAWHCRCWIRAAAHPDPNPKRNVTTTAPHALTLRSSRAC